MIIRKTASELEKMRRSGLLVHKILHALGAMVEEGISTWDLEVAAVKMMSDAGAKPAFKDYFVPAAGERYRYVLCTSVNEEIVRALYLGERGDRARHAEPQADY
jgi:methionyl aminopeptidase